MLKKSNILGVGITNETEEEISEYILQSLKNSKKKLFIATPNPEILVYSAKNPAYKKILNEAEIAIPDGTGLFLASILMLTPFKERIPGIDFMEILCKKSVRMGASIGILGGRRGVADKTAERLLRKYPNLNIVYVAEEWGEDSANLNERDKIKDLRLKNNSISRDPKSYFLNHKSIDLLFVAFGHPKQEEWIYKNLEKLPVKAAMGVGGAFDYISGEATRAPFIIRAIGFEWLFRLVKEPWRWKRQLALIEFVRLVFRERFQKPH